MLKYSQIHFKTLEKELRLKETTIRNLEKKILKQKEVIKKLRETNSTLKSKKPKTTLPTLNTKKKAKKDNFLKDISVEEEKKLAKYLRYLNRIENNIEYGKAYTRTDIKTNFQVPYHIFDWAINGLIKRGVVYEKQTTNGMRYYKK